MEFKRLTGMNAGSQKYDLLTAMAVAGLNGSPGFQTSMLRLIAIVTARYNWRADELTVGQRDMARMWAVDERTVKREIKRLTSAGILLQLRPGVRGRVAAYRLNQREICRLSAAYWDSVGPDFEERMAGLQPADEAPKVVRVDFGSRPVPASDTAWGRALDRLALTDPGLHGSWFSALTFRDCVDGIARLGAPSHFVAQYVQTHHLQRLVEALKLELPAVRRVIVEV